MMTIYGPVELLIVAMLTPFRFCRSAAPLASVLTVTLLTVAFQTDDSSIFGVPIDYAAIGLRLPDAVLKDHGWCGVGIWIGTLLFFLGGLGFWSLSLARAFHPFQRAWTPARAVRRVTLFVLASLLMPVVIVALLLVILVTDLEALLLAGSAFAPSQDAPDLLLLQDVAFLDFLLLILLTSPLIWLFLRLAIWPTIVLMTGWRHSLRNAWQTSRGLAGRWLCYFFAAAFVLHIVFDVAAEILYEIQWQLIDVSAFDTAVLLSIAGVGIACTVLLGFWINALMVLQVPDELIERDTLAADIF